MAENVKGLEKFKVLIDILVNVCIGLQVIVLFFVLLCSLYIACQIFEVHILEFTEPFMDLVRNFVVSAFGTSIQSNTPDVDGKIVFFVLLNIAVAYFLAQLKMAFVSYSKKLDNKIVVAKNEEEQHFNEQLKDKLEHEIRTQKNYLIAVQFKVKFLLPEGFGVTLPTDEEIERVKYDVVSSFFERIKEQPGLRFSKDEDILLISSSDIDHVDDVINKIWNILSIIKTVYKAQKYGVRMKSAIQSYRAMETLNSAYKTIKPLLNLNASNEMLCFGNFKNRYELIPDNNYIMAVKGKYDLKNGSEDAVWYLVKKD